MGEAGDADAHKREEARMQQKRARAAPAKVVHMTEAEAAGSEPDGLESAKTLKDDMEGLAERAKEQEQEIQEEQRKHAEKPKHAKNSKIASATHPVDKKTKRAVNLRR